MIKWRKHCQQSLFLSFQSQLWTFYHKVSPKSTDPILLYSVYSRMQNLNKVFLDSRLGPTLTCLVATTKKLQKPFVYTLQLAVHTVQINLICKQGIPYTASTLWTVKCQCYLSLAFPFIFSFFLNYHSNYKLYYLFCASEKTSKTKQLKLKI